MLTRQVRPARLRPVILPALFVASLAVAVTLTVTRLSRASAPSAQRLGLLTACADGETLALDAVGEWKCGFSFCPVGSYPYWKHDGTRCRFAGFPEYSPLPVNGSYTLSGDITSVAAGPLSGATSITATGQCRRRILDGAGKLIGTYIDECSGYDDTLTISTFELTHDLPPLAVTGNTNLGD